MCVIINFNQHCLPSLPFTRAKPSRQEQHTASPPAGRPPWLCDKLPSPAVTCCSRRRDGKDRSAEGSACSALNILKLGTCWLHRGTRRLSQVITEHGPLSACDSKSCMDTQRSCAPVLSIGETAPPILFPVWGTAV